MNFGIIRVRLFSTRAAKAPLLRLPHLTYLTYLTHLTILVLVSLLLSRAQAQEFQFQSVGARVGFPAENTSQHFRQAEAFLNYNLWGWNLSTNWRLQSRIDLSTGWLGQHGDNAFIGTLGPSLELSRARFPISLEAGFSPTYISSYQFGNTDLGARAQFTSHIGLNWDVTSRWRLGYRFQHMSNAGIKEPNPGFNLHVVSIGYLF
jgi:hypothetical protein